jgi:hypothetical protein
MGNSAGFGSGNVVWRSFDMVNWCIIQVQADASKRLSALAIAEGSLDIRKNRCAKELCVIPHPGNARRLWIPYVDQIIDTRHFSLSIVFDALAGRGSLDRAQAESCEHL